MRELKPFEHIYHIVHGRGITVRPEDIVHRFNCTVTPYRTLSEVPLWTISEVQLWALNIHAIFPEEESPSEKVVEITKEERPFVFAEGDYVQIMRATNSIEYNKHGFPKEDRRFKPEIFTFYRIADHNPTNASRFTVKDLDGNVSYAYDIKHAPVNKYDVERMFEIRDKLAELDRERDFLRREHHKLKENIRLSGDKA